MTLSADVQWSFQERVNAVEQATRFQDRPVEVLSDVEETTDGLRTQVGFAPAPVAVEQHAGPQQRRALPAGGCASGAVHGREPAGATGLLVAQRHRPACMLPAQPTRARRPPLPVPADLVCARVPGGGGHRRAAGGAVWCVWEEMPPGRRARHHTASAGAPGRGPASLFCTAAQGWPTSDTARCRQRSPLHPPPHPPLLSAGQVPGGGGAARRRAGPPRRAVCCARGQGVGGARGPRQGGPLRPVPPAGLGATPRPARSGRGEASCELGPAGQRRARNAQISSVCTRSDPTSQPPTPRTPWSHAGGARGPAEGGAAGHPAPRHHHRHAPARGRAWGGGLGGRIKSCGGAFFRRHVPAGTDMPSR